ncbi:hypothetical protein OO013_10560 [Mangrovivirga sp. M17]|uniref:Uncharacterized protein n=1 Tax=Mangrovivirga halotolerans TaxID=2993936 RepID=A0ABT3RRA6_9BACT|nr:hypothetical protein [Mangrovivirga halotolerans]MCX2744311.1 hypothetical protein [Mangrovivirga halotolerans]
MSTKIRKGNTLLTVVGLLFILTTGRLNNGPVKIPLENIDESTRFYGSHIAKDIFSSFSSDEGARYLLDKKYITPKIYQGINNSGQVFDKSYFMFRMMLGKIESFKLFGGEQPHIIRSLRYKLEVENEDQIKIGLNTNDDLAGYYLFVTTKHGEIKHENLLLRLVYVD